MSIPQVHLVFGLTVTQHVRRNDAVASLDRRARLIWGLNERAELFTQERRRT
jgi:hypothetical protein